MRACKKAILDRDNVCSIPATFDESALARTGGTVELPTDIPDAKVLEPLLESSKAPLLSPFPGHAMLISSIHRQILHGHPDHDRQPRFAKPRRGISAGSLRRGTQDSEKLQNINPYPGEKRYREDHLPCI